MVRPRRGLPPAERRARRAQVDDPEVVLAAALRFLEVRSRSVAEVRRRLVSAGYRPDLVDATVDRLAALGFLDDEAFARAWVESRDRAHPRGAGALRRELRQRGVDDEVVRGVLAEREGAAPLVADEGTDADASVSADERAARRLLERKASTLRRYPDPVERRRRAYALLARAGFDPDVCRRVASVAIVANDETSITLDAPD